MRLLIVFYQDDNFGDVLIRHCFERLLRTALCNRGITDCTLDTMALKTVEPEKIAAADGIFFAGGGLFGLSYLNFFDYLETVVRLAEQQGIPVVFSSVGINNMDATPETEQRLTELLRHRCIKAVSVRENVPLFRQYAAGCDFEVAEACDPAVWTREIYRDDIAAVPPSPVRRIGLNVVRGGLFGDNRRAFDRAAEFAYLDAVRAQLEAAGLAYVLYTNGSFLDNNTLRWYAKEKKLPEEQVCYTHTTRDLVQTVASCDAVAAIRMHSSIVAYSLGKPAVNLVWNDKIPFFYEGIGYPERALEPAQWTGEAAAQCLREAPPVVPDEDYRMSVYRFLYAALEKLFPGAGTPQWDYATVCRKLSDQPVPAAEDTADLRFKLTKGEQHYLSRLKELKKQEKTVKAQETKLREAEAVRTQLEQEIQTLKERERTLQEELAALNRLPVVRLHRRLHR